MKIIYCSWNENSKNDLQNALEKLADEVIFVEHGVKEYLGNIVDTKLDGLLDETIDAVISFDFFPNISNLCMKKDIPYVSWVYDWPNYTLFDPAIYNSCNKVYLFERNGIAHLESYRVSTIKYSPLAVDCHRLADLLGSDIRKTEYQYDVSFVGNMYLNLQGAMMSEHVPAYYEGFVNALASAQQKIYGYNFANDVITPEFAEKYLRDIQVAIDGIKAPKEFVLATQINKYITGIERKHLLEEIGKKQEIHLFTQSKLEPLQGVIVHGGVDYDKEMPQIFRNSKINLNMTLRSITSGIPLRVFDILGAGGFCLTNYQEGINEHFVDGRDLVMYTSVDDMLEKIDYYLSHENERMKIAQFGYQAVQQYDYQEVLKSIMQEALS